MTTPVVMHCPTRFAMVALAAVMILLSNAAHADSVEGIYTCRPESLQIFPPPSSVALASAEGEVGIEVTGGQVEIYLLQLSAHPEGLHAPLTFSLDPARQAVGPLRPLISSFEIPVGLLVGRGAGSASLGAEAHLFANFVTGGISGILSGQLPASSQQRSFVLDLVCAPTPPTDVLSSVFTRINDAQGRICSTIKLANLELTRLDPSEEQITLPAACDPPPPQVPTCTEASCECLCIGLSDCIDMIVDDSYCQDTQGIDCDHPGPVVSCTCRKRGCVLGGTGGPEL